MNFLILNFYLFTIIFGIIYSIFSALNDRFKNSVSINFWSAFGTLFLSGLSILFVSGQYEFLHGGLIFNSYSKFVSLLIIFISLSTVVLFRNSYFNKDFFKSDVIAIFLSSILGAVIAVSSYDFITVFIGLEMMSICLYVLVGYIHTSKLSKEASVKYLIMGIISSGFLVFGIALFYLIFGSLRFDNIVSIKDEFDLIHKMCFVFITTGLGFKLALIPFHMWAPDVYEASPAPLVGFMSSFVKVVVLALFLKIFSKLIISNLDFIHFIFYYLTLLTIFFGNIVALMQKSLKRLLAYSSIVNSGYMFLIFLALSKNNIDLVSQTLFFYLIFYSIAIIGVFGMINHFEKNNVSLDDLDGLGNKYPLFSYVFSIFLISLAGLPPTISIVSKILVFKLILINGFYFASILFVIGSLISLYYYILPIIKMFFSNNNSKFIDNIKLNYNSFSFIFVLILASSLLFSLFFVENILNLINN